jgi:hypothetical protein
VADSDESFFVCDIAKASISETWRVSNHSPLGTIMVTAFKLLGLSWRGGLPISQTPPLEIELSDLPHSVAEAFRTPLQAFRELSFEQVLVTHKQDFSNQDGYAIHLLSTDKLITASLMWASVKIGYIKREVVTYGLNSRRQNGEMIATSGFGGGLNPPPGVAISRMPGASVVELTAAHRKRIADVIDVIPFEPSRLAKDIEDFGCRTVEFNLQRSVYVPATIEEIRRARSHG